MKFYNEKFREARNMSRWTIVSLARECGVTRQTVFLWEKGKAVPSESKVREIARILNVKVSAISDLDDIIPHSEINPAPVLSLWNTLANSDISGRQQKRDQIIRQMSSYLNEQEQVYAMVRGLLNSLESIFYFKDSQMKYLIANKAFMDNLSLKHDYNVHGKTDQDFFNKHEADENDREDEQVLKSGKSVVNREAYIPGSRKTKWGMTSKYPIFDNENKVIGVLGNVVDITQTKQIEFIQRLLYEALNMVDICMSIYTVPQNEYIFCTSLTYKFFGFDENVPVCDIEEYWLENIVHPDDRKEQRRIVSSRNIPPLREYRIIHPEKGIRTIKVINYKTQNMNKTYLISLSIDVTKQS